jgi:hypothetical protein
VQARERGAFDSAYWLWQGAADWRGVELMRRCFHFFSMMFPEQGHNGEA